MADRERYPVLSVEEAQERVLALVRPLEAESVPLLQALDRVLAEPIVADMDVPPLANSGMDGYALRAEDIRDATQQSPARLRVIGELAAGQISPLFVGPGEALRIMTGAPVPAGSDTVVRFEDTRQSGDTVEIYVADPRGRNVRAAGEDVRQGQTVLQPGARLRPAEIGMLALAGRATVQVVRRPRVAILATGDEVADLGEPVAPGQIRNINSYACAAQVTRWGGLPLLLGLARDRRDELAAKLEEGLALGADLLVTSGGVSAGDFDLVKQVLAAAGRIDFWWVNMKPARPVAFGAIRGTPLLGLPGNPVAAMVSLALLGRPAIRKMAGHTTWEWPSVLATLREPIARKDGRRHYLRVRLARQGEGWLAELTGDQGAGIVSSMVQADGLAIIPEDVAHLPAGSPVRVLLLD
ncbi:MAG: molybdopterin molybdotransferase MoeA [Chloroflexi bacterium]|nr:molybdopterin molybdotransferase MoeA [Chloroflexota bacterium]